jgi:hypothetical protein
LRRVAGWGSFPWPPPGHNDEDTREMKALLIGPYIEKKEPIAYAQLYPFFEHREALRTMIGFEFDHREGNTFAEIGAVLDGVPDMDGYDAIFLRPTWRHSSDEAVAFFSGIRQKFPRHRIVLVDPWDQVTGRYLCVAPHVDHILKYQGLKDPAGYQKEYIGGTIVSDYLARNHGYEIGDWDVGSRVPEGYLDRVLTGWNFAVTPRFQKQLFPSRLRQLFDFTRRDIDIFCRVNYGPTNNLEWYGRYRMEAVETLQTLASEYRLAVSGEFSDTKTVSARQYLREIRRARIAFSPFGWGEVTWRDYEAIAYGCLLVKPRVDHVDTNPHVFVPGETYVPVEWDFSDLADKCRHYLAHWDEAEVIIGNARRMYRDFFEKRRFVDLIRPVI